MFKNYFKTAWRNLVRQKSNSVINITGLVVGLAAFLLIFLVIQYEQSFDNFHPAADHIIRLRLDFHDQGKLTMQSATVYPGIAPMMKKEFVKMTKKKIKPIHLFI